MTEPRRRSARGTSRGGTVPDALPELPADAADLSARLCAWYRAHKRDLPWRHARDPYAVWVSEVMLQQTQVETVRRYWGPFLQRFPTPSALADAPQEEVLSAWSGLGYYRRARFLHRAAQHVVAHHAGRFPVTPEGIRGLPGVGAYTAGAVLSIALGQPAAAVDGNVVRVLSRVLGVTGPAREPPVFAGTALSLHGGEPPGDVTQGLMELGATVCTPRAPRCDACPWKDACRARAMDAVDAIPPPRVRAARKPLHVACVLAEDARGVVLRMREGDGLFGGMWELPGVEVPAASTGRAPGTATLRRALATALPGFTPGLPLATTERTLTHRDLRITTFATSSSPATLPDGMRRVRAADLQTAPLATAMRAALKDARAVHAGLAAAGESA